MRDTNKFSNKSLTIIEQLILLPLKDLSRQIFMLLKIHPHKNPRKTCDSQNQKNSTKLNCLEFLDIQIRDSILNKVSYSNNCFMIKKIYYYDLMTGCFVRLSRSIKSGFFRKHPF